MHVDEFRKKIANGEISFNKKDKRRVRNAKSINDNGKLFQSTLEYKFAVALKTQYNGKFELKPKLIIIPSFEYDGEHVKAMTWTPDFYFPSISVIVDTKGHITDEFELKLKLIKWKLKSNPIKIYLLPNQKLIPYFILELNKMFHGEKSDLDMYLAHNVIKENNKRKRIKHER